MPHLAGGTVRAGLLAVALLAVAGITALCVSGVDAAHRLPVMRASVRTATSPPSTPSPTVTDTPTPALTPTAPATLLPTLVPVPAFHRVAPPRNRLASADGSMDTGVGVYADCHGATPLPRYEAAIDTCVSGRIYFVGHNPGVFSPLFNQGVGALIAYWDGAGVRHELRIIARRDWARDQDGGLAPPVSGDVVAQFQTCISTTEELILDAVAA